MRVIHIIPNLRKGGAERLVIDIVREILRSKCAEVRLVIFRDTIEYDVSDLANVIVHIPSSISLSPIRKNSYHVSGLQKFIESFKPDVIHSHLFEAEIISRSCYYPQAKWFSHCHNKMPQFQNLGISAFTNKIQLINYYEKKFLFHRYKINKGTHFVAISKNTKSFYASTASCFPVSLINNAIDYKRFNQKHTPNLSSLTYKIISIGTLNVNKNHQYLLDVSSYLKVREIPFELTIIGEGSERSNLESTLSSSHLQSFVKLIGAKNNIEEYLCKSHIYVHSSKSEALGLTIIEAMAAGLPVVCLDGGGNAELIKDGVNGYLLPQSATPQEFADKILTVLKNEEHYHSMSVNARAFAENFDIGPYVNRLMKLYESVKL